MNRSGPHCYKYTQDESNSGQKKKTNQHLDIFGKLEKVYAQKIILKLKNLVSTIHGHVWSRGLHFVTDLHVCKTKV